MPVRMRQPGIRCWKDAMLGVPAFLIGNGCSVIDNNARQLQEHFTIGINRAFRLFDPVVLFWQDRSLWESESQKLLRSSSIKVCCDAADPQHRFFNYSYATTKQRELPEYPDRLGISGPTGPLAFAFAYSLGCNPIVLVGFDCKYRAKNTDFYGTNPMHFDGTLKECLKGLTWLHDLHTDREIINCSDNDVFTKTRDITDVVRSLPTPKGRSYYIRTLQRLVENPQTVVK